MKKRLLFFIAAVFTLVVFMGVISAPTCEELNVNVCGTTPNSAVGYGAVDLCNNCHPCGVADGVCPEDFYSTVTGMQGSCRNCPDVDCTANVHGWVKTTEGYPVSNAGVYVTHATGQIQIGTTDAAGYYTTDTAVAGLVKFHASYEDYDTDIVSAEIIRGSSNNEINITISPGACNEDCTDIFGTVCKASCRGVSGCSFTDASPYYTSEQISYRCDGKAPGTRYPVFQNLTHIIYAQCCDQGLVTEERPVLEPLDEGENDCIKNLGTYTVKANYRGQTVRVVVKSWDSNCE